MTTNLIAFCGPKGAGKTLASKLLRRMTDDEWRPYAFADPLREMLGVLGITREQSRDPATKDRPLQAFGGRTPRQLLVSLGTTWGRQMIDPHIWLNQAARRIPRLRGGLGVQGVVVDDLRFDNEAELVKDLGGRIIEIERPGHDYTPAEPTEAGINPAYIDQRISAATSADLTRAIAKLVASL